MRIKKVSSDRVTVYLSSGDLEFFNFHPDGDPPKVGDLHNFLFELMEVVRSETGFDPYNGGQVMVEAMHSSEGMKLEISKIGVSKPRKLTREQFNKAKSVRVRTKDFEFKDINALSKEEFLRLIRNISACAKDAIDRKPGRETFIFADFSALEATLCLLDSDDFEEFVLYRREEKYAIVAKIKRWEKTYNLLSEFSESNRGGDILAADIREGWKEVARGEALQAMADAVKSMR
ncbi:MAG: adaptor protein MecA [Oscillospiraceae bacterium]|nr:adaptor protein MecA [Oscillospiraceae bacterium]